MEHPQHTPRGAECGSSVRRCSGALLLLAIATLLIACGGAGGGPGSTVPATSNTATLTWNPVTATNLSGYRVYFDTASITTSGTYGQGINVGNVTTYTVTGLAGGSQYYFAVTALDNFGSESPYSNEASKLFP